jgi:hypothetical protein
MVCPVEIGFEALMCGVFITVRDKVPTLPAYQRRKEPTGIGRPDHLGMLGEAEEREPFAVALANEPMCLCLRKEREKPSGLLQIFRHDVLQCGGSQWRLLVLELFFDTRGSSAGGGCCVMEGERW